MLNYDFALDGISALSKGIISQTHITFYAAEPKVETLSIAGRNGDLHIYDGSYSNVTGEGEFYVLGLEETYEDVSAALHRVNDFLMKTNGYRRLEVSYEPYTYRMARIKAAAEYDPKGNRIAPFKIEFDCKPQRFLKSGETAVTFTESSSLTNPTLFDALPLIRVTGSGDGQLTIGESTISLADISDYVDIDSELQDAYKGTENKNSTMTGDFPVLVSGANVVSFSGGITSVTITPRWWTL